MRMGRVQSTDSILSEVMSGYNAEQEEPHQASSCLSSIIRYEPCL